MLNLSYSGKGYAYEAARAYFGYLFREKGARRIYAYTEDYNLPSQRLCERLGMRREGLFVEFVSFVSNSDGTPLYENTIQYAILKKEWEKAAGNDTAAAEQELRKHRCCFTGHRPEKLHQSPLEVQQWLSEQIQTAMREGFVTFITGMAMGVDIWAGEQVLRMRDNDPRIHLIAIAPWPGFASRWNEEWKKRYDALLQAADIVRYASRSYDSSVFTKRNEWMVDHSARVIACYNGAEGGTKETIEYALRQGVDVILGGERSPEKAMPPEEASGSSVRGYPLNLLDAILDCDAYRNAPPVQSSSIPGDCEKRLRAAGAIIQEGRAYRLLFERYHDRQTLQAIAEGEGLSRERIRQLLNKYLRRLRNPDILRFLNCGVDCIPEKTSAVMVERLEKKLREMEDWNPMKDS